MSDARDSVPVEEQEARMSVARAKAEAARLAVERRRSTSSGAVDRSHSVGSNHQTPYASAVAPDRNRSASVHSGRAGSEVTGDVIIKRRPVSGAVTPNRSTTPVQAGTAGRSAEAAEEHRANAEAAAEAAHAHAATAAAEAEAAAAAAQAAEEEAAAEAAAQAAEDEAAAAQAAEHEARAAQAEREAAIAQAAEDEAAAAEAAEVAAAAQAAEEIAAAQAAAEAEAAAEAAAEEEYYASAIEELRREQAQLAEDDATLEQRLQLYSEVVGLRKELAVVQEDEERLRQQLANTEAVIAASDPEVAKEVAILEDEAQQSTLQKVWVEESEYHNPDNMEWAEVDVNNLHERLEAARAKFLAASEKADALYAQQEEAINETTDAREREKAAIGENHDREMENLDDARAHARQVASEQHYHRHRGTANRAEPVVPKEKERTTRQRRVDEVEFKTTAQVARMKDDLAELMEEVKILKRQLDDSRASSEAKLREHEAALKVVEDEGADAREMKEKLIKEEEELKELKADLQGVLHYVRAKNREEEGW